MDILVVDDDNSNRLLMNHILSNIAKIQLAHNGLDAVDMVEKHLKSGSSFDVIFMDVVLPDIDGFETIRRIKSAEKSLKPNKKSKIVVLTSYDLIHSKWNAIANDCDSFLVKPVEKYKILAQIQKLV